MKKCQRFRKPEEFFSTYYPLKPKEILVLKDVAYEVVENTDGNNCDNCDINIKNRLGSDKNPSCSRYVASSISKSVDHGPCRRTDVHFKRLEGGL